MEDKRSIEEFLKEFDRTVRKHIKRIGWSVLVVGSTVLENTPYDPDKFAYTIGLTKNFNHPEIFFFLPHVSEVLYQIANKIGMLISKGSEFSTGKKYGDIIHNGYKVMFRKVSDEGKSNYLVKAEEYYENDNFEALQVIFPDIHGKFPHEKNYREDHMPYQKFI